MRKQLYTITDNIDIWIKKHFKVDTKQKALEWRQDNIPHKQGDKKIAEALGIKKPDKSKQHNFPRKNLRNPSKKSKRKIHK